MKAFIVFSMALAIAASAAVDESKKEKRGLYNLESDHGSDQGSFDQHSYQFPQERSHGGHQQEVKHIPYPVEVVKRVPYEVKVPYPVEVEKKVYIEKKVPVYIEKEVKVHVDRPVPYKVEVKVPVIQKEYVEVPKPYAVHVDKPVPVYITKPVYIEKAVPVTFKIKEHKKSFWG